MWKATVEVLRRFKLEGLPREDLEWMHGFRIPEVKVSGFAELQGQLLVKVKKR